MFKMCGPLAVFGDHSPLVFQNFHVLYAHVHHGFNGKSHPFLQWDSLARRPIIRNLRFLVEIASDAVKGALGRNSMERSYWFLESDVRVFRGFDGTFNPSRRHRR